MNMQRAELAPELPGRNGEVVALVPRINIHAFCSSRATVEAMQLAKEAGMPSEMLQRAYRFFEDKAGGAIQHDWYEYRLTRPSHDLQVRLHMVNLAAQAIQAQKRQEREAAERAEDAAEEERAAERARG